MTTDLLRRLFDYYIATAPIGFNCSSYKARLDSLMRFMPSPLIGDSAFVEASDQMIKSGMSRTTVQLYINTARAAVSWAVKRCQLPSDRFIYPKVGCSPSKRMAFTDEDIESLLAMPKINQAEWNYAIICAADTGLRLGDVVNLKFDDVSDGVINVVPIKTKRTGKSLTIPATERLINIINTLQYGCSGCDIAPNLAGQWMLDRHKTLSMQFIRMCHKANIYGLSFHCLRHYRVTSLVEKGVHPSVIASITGHSLPMIMRYTHVSMETKRKAVS